MTDKEIRRNLCVHDERNPEYVKYEPKYHRKDPCFCDNCFYGRTELANELIRVKQKQSDLTDKTN